MMTVDEVLKMVSDGEQIPANVALDNFFQVAYECLNLQDEINGLTGSLDRAEKALKEAQEHEQEPVAFWWIGPDGKDNGGPYRGKPSDAAIDNALNMGCEPVLLYARPVPAAPAVAAGLPAIGPYRDFIPAPAEPTVAVPAVPTDEQIHVAYREALGQSIRERDMPEIRKFARALLQSASVPAVAAPAVPDDCVSQDESTMMMAASALVLYRAGESAEYMAKAIEAMLQSSDVKEFLTTQPDCRACANRGQVNGLSQESYCDSCVYQGRDWRQNHFVDVSEMVDAVKRRCEACVILPCSCK